METIVNGWCGGSKPRIAQHLGGNLVATNAPLGFQLINGNSNNVLTLQKKRPPVETDGL